MKIAVSRPNARQLRFAANGMATRMMSSAASSGRRRTTRVKKGGAATQSHSGTAKPQGADRPRGQVRNGRGQSGVEHSQREPSADRGVDQRREGHQENVEEEVLVAAAAEKAEARPRDLRGEAVMRVEPGHREVVVRIGIPEDGHPQVEESEEEEGDDEARGGGDLERATVERVGHPAEL